MVNGGENGWSRGNGNGHGKGVGECEGEDCLICYAFGNISNFYNIKCD